jgi:hypothetical protein
MASYKKYPSAGQPSRQSSDEIAPASDAEAGTLRAQAARYRRLAGALIDPRVIGEVQACAVELDAEAARIEGRARINTPLPICEVMGVGPIR